MKQRISPEMDSMMWAIAEERDPKAIEEFGARYPELRAELGKRLSLVRGLQTARPGSRRPPSFSPRPEPPRGMRPLPAALGLLALVALGWAGYMAGKGFGARPVDAPPAVAQANLDEPLPSDPQIAYQPPPNRPFTQIPNDAMAMPPGSEQPPTPAPNVTDLRVDNTPLMSAIELLAAGSGYTVMFAPGMSNPTVSTDYRNQSMMDILKDLGREYKFTVFDEGNRTLLVIPATPQDVQGVEPGMPRPAELEGQRKEESAAPRGEREEGFGLQSPDGSRP